MEPEIFNEVDDERYLAIMRQYIQQRNSQNPGLFQDTEENVEEEAQGRLKIRNALIKAKELTNLTEEDIQSRVSQIWEDMGTSQQELWTDGTVGGRTERKEYLLSKWRRFLQGEIS